MLLAKEILKNRFGYDDFRLDQEKIIGAVLEKKDVLALMPTGGGKSLCYQIPALLFPGLTVVISPLIALMKDQVGALKLNGIPSAFLNSSLTGREQSDILLAAEAGELKLLYVAPERLFSQDPPFLEFLKRLSVSLFAIDEARCISQWGHDFRPEYMKLAALKRHFPEVPVMALTATADELTRKDILEKLQLNAPAVFISSFDRKNIYYFVRPKKNSRPRLLAYLSARRQESGIIYVLSRRSAERWSDELEARGFSVKPYHAGLDSQTRAENQELFIQDKVKIMVATIAFGMGIDKSNVRYVVHLDMPKNIEGYYQETGRAGRDGLKSEAVLFYSPGDVIKLKHFARVSGNPNQTRILFKKLNQMADFCEIKTVCRRNRLLNYLGEDSPDRCDACDVCLGRVGEEVVVAEAPYEAELFKILRAMRMDLAREAGMPAFVIFSDATLVELCAYLPQTMEDLRRISGFGEVKLARYGTLFLKAVTDYSRERGLSSRIEKKYTGQAAGDIRAAVNRLKFNKTAQARI
ncbi:MAG: RecQ family ATP-dependent DNA helicase [Candidatus Omnitrophica bacterium]|nr:RecQ family ATP-dependent DNA helicase [Candidatus Omnitrophota bacterium]